MSAADALARFHARQTDADAKKIAALEAQNAQLRLRLAAMEVEKERHRAAARRNKTALESERLRVRTLKATLNRIQSRDFLSPTRVA